MPWNDKESRAIRRKTLAAIDRRMNVSRPASKRAIKDTIDCTFPRGAADQMCIALGTTYRAANIDQLEMVLRAGAWSHAYKRNYREFFEMAGR
jgi:hypothetical protein